MASSAIRAIALDVEKIAA